MIAEAGDGRGDDRRLHCPVQDHGDPGPESARTAMAAELGGNVMPDQDCVRTDRKLYLYAVNERFSNCVSNRRAATLASWPSED